MRHIIIKRKIYYNKSQLKIGYEKTHIHYLFFFYIHKKINIQKAHEIKNNIFHYWDKRPEKNK